MNNTSEIYGYAGLNPCDDYILNNPALTAIRPHCAANDDFVVVCKEFVTTCHNTHKSTMIMDMLSNAIPTTKNDDLLKLFDDDSVADTTLAYKMQSHGAIYCRMGAKPLVIGIGGQGNYLANQVKALQAVADKYIALCHGEKAKITKDKITIYNKKGIKIKKSPVPIDKDKHFDYDYSPADEIYCCQNGVSTAVSALCNGGKIHLDQLKINGRAADKFNHIILMGEGTSYNACLGAKYVFELMCNIPTTAISSTEFIHSAKIVGKNTLVIALSQTGETTPTVWGADYAVKNGAKTVALTADSDSHLARICPYVINTDCQLTSQKVSLRSFINSYLCLCLVALYIGNKRSIVSQLYLSVTIKMAQLLTGKIIESTKPSRELDMLTYMIKNAENLIITGCSIDYCVAREVSAKMWDIAQINAKAVQTDTLPHTNTSNHTIVAIISSKDYLSHTAQILKNAQNQGAKVIVVTTSGIESDLVAFDNIVSFSDSIPIFNILPIVTGIYKSTVTACDDAKSFCQTY